MSTSALVALALAIVYSAKAFYSLTGYAVYKLDPLRESRDIVLRRRKRFKWSRYIIIALFFWGLTISQIKFPSISIKSIQTLEIAP